MLTHDRSLWIPMEDDLGNPITLREYQHLMTCYLELKGVTEEEFVKSCLKEVWRWRSLPIKPKETWYGDELNERSVEVFDIAVTHNYRPLPEICNEIAEKLEPLGKCNDTAAVLHELKVRNAPKADV